MNIYLSELSYTFLAPFVVLLVNAVAIHISFVRKPPRCVPFVLAPTGSRSAQIMPLQKCNCGGKHSVGYLGCPTYANAAKTQVVTKLVVTTGVI